MVERRNVENTKRLHTHLFQFNIQNMIQMKTRFVDDKQYMCLKRFGSQNIKHINRASGSCNKVSLFFRE